MMMMIMESRSIQHLQQLSLVLSDLCSVNNKTLYALISPHTQKKSVTTSQVRHSNKTVYELTHTHPPLLVKTMISSYTSKYSTEEQKQIKPRPVVETH